MGEGFDYALDVGLFVYVYGGQFGWWPGQCSSSVMAAVIRYIMNLSGSLSLNVSIRMITDLTSLSGRMWWEPVVAYIKALFWFSSWRTERNTREQARLSVLSRSFTAVVTWAVLHSKRASTENLVCFYVEIQCRNLEEVWIRGRYRLRVR
jgi:hypothetical protein